MVIDISATYCNFICAVNFGPGTTLSLKSPVNTCYAFQHIVLLLGVQENCFRTLAVYMSLSLEMKIGLCALTSLLYC